MWRIANDYIPTLYNIRTPNLVVNILCPVCKTAEETVSHLFRDCSFTQQVLRGLGVIVVTCNEDPNWKTWLAIEFNNLSIEECKSRAIAYWAIWYNRNKIYHDGVREQVNKVVGFVQAYCTEIAALGVVL